jgi:uncharacterized protein YjcR
MIYFIMGKRTAPKLKDLAKAFYLQGLAPAAIARKVPGVSPRLIHKWAEQCSWDELPV